jgi:hypothetical protein
MADDKPDNDTPISADQLEPQPDIWELISPGRPVAYEPEELWAKACKYFEWAKASPLKEEKHFGTGLSRVINHPKPFTKQGLCVFLNISVRTFDSYATRAEYQPFTDTIRSVLFDQKFSAAAAGLMNANIIARELGLAERVTTAPDVSDMTDEQIDQRYQELMAKEHAQRKPLH